MTSEDIDKAIEIFVQNKALAVVGVKEVEVNSLFVSEIGDDLSMNNHYGKIKKLNKLRSRISGQSIQ